MQKDYFHRYGTPLRGLMVENGMDPEAYLAAVHDIDYSVLAPDPVLKAALAALPGRRTSTPTAAPAMPKRFWSGWGSSMRSRRSSTFATPISGRSRTTAPTTP